MHDDHTVELLNMFNVENRSPFIPERAYRMFIKRTLTIISQEWPTNHTV